MLKSGQFVYVVVSERGLVLILSLIRLFGKMHIQTPTVQQSTVVLEHGNSSVQCPTEHCYVCEGSQALSVCPSDKTSEMKMRTERCRTVLTGETAALTDKAFQIQFLQHKERHSKS